MNKHILNIITISIMMVISNNLIAQQQKSSNNEEPVALFVEFQFEAANMNFALDLLTEVQNQTIEHEEGCIAYDILVSNEEPNTIYLYECYENEVALDAHNKASYFKEIVTKKLPSLIKKQKILKLTPINNLGIMM